VENVCKHFGRNVHRVLSVDAADWSSQAADPVMFRRLDLRVEPLEVLRLLKDQELFPLENRLLVIGSTLASDMLLGASGDGTTSSHLLELMLSELPLHADFLLLEPFSRSTSLRGDDLAGKVCAAASSAGWAGFVYSGVPSQGLPPSSFFLSRSELPGLLCISRA